MFNEDEQVVDSAETTTEDNHEDYENDSDSEDEGTSQAEESEQRKPETSEARQSRLKRQAEREAKKLGVSLQEYLGIESKKASEEGSHKETSKVDSDEKYNRLYLKTEGYTVKAEQDIVLDYADWKGVEIDEALKSPIVKGEIKEYRDKASTPKPSTRTSRGASNSVDALVAKYRAGKYLAPDEMRQVRKKLRG